MKINPKVDPISYVERWKKQKETEKVSNIDENKTSARKAEPETSKEVKQNGKKRKAES
ncbi:MAG: hypothetical protein IJ740_18870 [Ruminococcus sp.]|nr:hypothetical protein [Ruminococcus sp.]MBR1752905.1 hypothetical protein [Ruminococcus sp.]